MRQILVRYTADGGIARLELSDPPANAYTHEMMLELDDAILTARFDPAVHVIVLTGAGEKFFCAGANIGMLAQAEANFKYYFCLHANETLNRLEQTPKLVIAALNGHAVGGGLEIALAADLRLARKGAGKIGFPEVHLGVLPGTGGTQRLTRVLGRSRALELMVTGRNFSFEEAAEMGLVHKVLDAADFHGQVLEYARGFLPPSRASRAVGHIKRAVVTGGEIPFETALSLERELQQRLFESEDAREGLAAYLAKRTPQFKGR